MKPTLFSSSSQPLPHQNQISKKSTLVVLYVRQLSIGLLFFISIVMVNAQNIGINPTGTPPHASAGLDVNYTDKGLLLPRVNLTSETDATTIPAPAISLMVYNTNATKMGEAIERKQCVAFNRQYWNDRWNPLYRYN